MHSFISEMLFLLFIVAVTTKSFNGIQPRWRVLPIRSENEYNAGMIGGEAEQHNHAITRSPSDPSILYLSHDCGHVWISRNSGESWKKTLGVNLTALAGQSIEVDPVHPNKVLIIMNTAYNWLNREGEGLYLSEDYGDTFSFVKQIRTGSSRRYEHNIAYDESSIDSDGAQIWYAAFWYTDTEHGIYKSEDYGNSFDIEIGKVPTTSTSLRYYSIYVHPESGKENILFVASNDGLYKVDVDTKVFTDITGDLPSRTVTSIQICPETYKIYVNVLSNGLYVSEDDGESFTLVRSCSTAQHVFMNKGFPNELYHVGSNGVGQTAFSDDSGETWVNVQLIPPNGLSRSYKTRMGGAMTGLMPNPTLSHEAVGYTYAAIWKTTNGSVWKDSSTLYTGFNCGIYKRTMSWNKDDPNKFGSFMADVGFIYTNNTGKWFTHNPVPYTWYSSLHLMDWISMGPGLVLEDDHVVAPVGNVFSRRILYSDNNADDWTMYGYEDSDVTTLNSLNPKKNYWRAISHPEKNLIFMGAKKSTDYGQTWTDMAFLSTNNHQVIGFSYTNENEFVLFAINTNRNELFRSYDEGETWESFVSTSGFTMNGVDSIPIVEIHPSNPDVFYTVHNRNELVKYNGTGFEFLGVREFVGNSKYNLKNFPNRIMIDPINNDVIYVGMFLSGAEKIFLRSTEGGKVGTWEDISINLPRVSVGSININPHTGEVFRGSCDGHFVFLPPYDRIPGVEYVYDNAYDFYDDTTSTGGNATVAAVIVLSLLVLFCILFVIVIGVFVIIFLVMRKK